MNELTILFENESLRRLMCVLAGDFNINIYENSIRTNALLNHMSITFLKSISKRL